MAEEQTANPINSLLAEFGTRLNEVEEKQRLVRDRALLIGENLITTKEESEKKDFELRTQINEINLEIRNMKQLVHRIVNEIPNLARRSEIELLENQAKMFKPLELTTKKEVELMINEAIKKAK
jgi:ABC-type antimicrobial peptide transport system ATPase subunit